jgi:[ribosomal protein S5]-alanine N-acetyltransferase
MEFKLRPWRASDLDSLVKFGNNPAIAANMSDMFPNPYTPEKGKAFIDMATQDEPARIMAIEVLGEAAGGIGLHPQQDIYRLNAELGYWLAEPYWRKGIITRAIKQMTQYGFEHLDINRIFARPFGYNKASQTALEKAGFTLEARLKETIIKNGVVQDELIYAIRRGQLLLEE